jgi:uncharacterized hydrophobic protein (TIGR00341 family)
MRLIEMILPPSFTEEAKDILKDFGYEETWDETLNDDRRRIKCIVPTQETKKVLDALEKRFGGSKGVHILLVPVEASIPRLETKKETPQEQKKEKIKGSRLSREELYADIEQMSRSSVSYIIMIILASIVASIGFLRDNVVFIIGAMVIAPVLGPNVALSFGTTLGDIPLSQRAVRTIALGTASALAFSALLGLILRVDPGAAEMTLRTQVRLEDIALALAAGGAAALALTSGLSSVLIGVMVAVALLPPLVTAGLLMGSGYWDPATGALMLFFVNLICVNLSGVVTFLIQGIRPLTWWEAARAKKSTRNAILSWTLLLLILAALIIIGS